ncbi:MAG: ATP-binding cassette domain-containing protein [Bacilli bacterium]
MIELKNINLSFLNQCIFSNASITLPNKGLYFVLGPSGCGKSSFLHLLCGLLKYQGNIKINGNNISSFSKTQMDDFRLKNIGLVFQDYKLLSYLSVYENIVLPLSGSNLTDSIKLTKAKSLLSYVGLNNYLNKTINELSGGEAQRVALARSLINSPSLLLCDEPTGSIDKFNRDIIMQILKKYSQNNLVIVVTHDESLIDQFCDGIIYIKNHKFILKKFVKKKENQKLLLDNNNGFSFKGSLSLKVLRKIYKSKNNKRKVQTFFIRGFTSLGILGVGVSLLLSSFISTSIKKSYSEILLDNEIIMNKNIKNSEYVSSLNEEEALSKIIDYRDYIKDIGICYLNDFSSFFSTSYFYLNSSSSKKQIIDDLSIQHINDFLWLDNYPFLNVYPSKPSTLQDDEIILGASINTIRQLCLFLGIPRNISSLSYYLKNNDLYISLLAINESWSYYDEQIFKVVGFSLEKSNVIYHYNHRYNEYILQTRMRFDSVYDINKETYYPWTLKKAIYYEIEDYDNFLNKSFYDPTFDDVYLDRNKEYYFPSIFKNLNNESQSRFLLFFKDKEKLKSRLDSIIKSTSNKINDVYFMSDKGYTVYSSSLMKGFYYPFFFSFNKEKLESAVDIDSQNDDINTISLFDEVIKGHYTLSKSEGVFFKSTDEVDIGRLPQNYDEIIVSSSFLKKLNMPNDKVPSEPLLLAVNNKTTYLSESSVNKEYVYLNLKVTGIKNSSLFNIYQNPNWLIIFFQTRLNVSIFDLDISSFLIEGKSGKDMKDIKEILMKTFPSFTFSSPLLDINESVNNTMKYIELIILCFSLVSLSISLLLYSLSLDITLEESKKDISLIRCLGFPNLESVKIVFFNSLAFSLTSFFVSSFELIMFSFVYSFVLNVDFFSLLKIRPFIYMLIISILIAFFSSLLNIKKVMRMDILQASQ